MHKTQSEAKATRPCKPSRALTVQVTIPAKAAPLLLACVARAGLTPEDYAWGALAALLQCDADYIRDEALDLTSAKLGGAR